MVVVVEAWGCQGLWRMRSRSSTSLLSDISIIHSVTTVLCDVVGVAKCTPVMQCHSWIQIQIEDLAVLEAVDC